VTETGRRMGSKAFFDGGLKKGKIIASEQPGRSMKEERRGTK